MNSTRYAATLGNIALLAGALALAAPACMGPTELGDGVDGPSGSSENPESPNPPDEDPELCVGTGVLGTGCEVTADCIAPLICVDGECVGPQDPNHTCDPIEGIPCPEENEVCVAGVCVVDPGECETDDDCPVGYICVDGQCVPDNGGEPCADPGPGPALGGTWSMRSYLHLREGLPGIAEGFLDLSELLADFIEGDVDLGLPAMVEALIGALVQGIIDEYVPQWGQDLIVALAGVSDVLDDLQVDSTVWLEGQVCDANYRGASRWDWITFEYRGNVITRRPEDIAEIGEVRPEDFGAKYYCGDLFIDKHRIKNVLSGLVHWIANTLVEISTGYTSVEAALNAAIQCPQIADALNDAWQSACDCTSDISGAVEAACLDYKDDLIAQVVTLLEEATVSLSVVSLKGIADIPDAYHMTDGRWYGSVLGGDFPGEFTAHR